MGTAIVLIGLSAVLYVVEDSGAATGRWATAAKTAVILLMFFAPIGVARGLVRVLTTPKQERSKPASGRRSVAVVSAITALAGLATAIVSFAEAIED